MRTLSTIFSLVLCIVVFTIASTNITSSAKSTTASALTSESVISNQYDLNGDGIVNETDFEELKDLVIVDTDSNFNVSDIVSVHKFILANSFERSSESANYSNIPVSQENTWKLINYVSKDNTLIKVSYIKGNVIVSFEDSYSSFEAKFNEFSDYPYGTNDIIVSFGANDLTYVVWVEDGHYRLAMQPLIGQAASAICVTAIPVTEDTTWTIRNWLTTDNTEFETSIKEMSSGGVTITFENSLYYFTMIFDSVSTQKFTDDMVLVSSTIDDQLVIIWTDGYAYHLSLQ
jgi:hypothetical protein